MEELIIDKTLFDNVIDNLLYILEYKLINGEIPKEHREEQ